MIGAITLRRGLSSFPPRYYRMTVSTHESPGDATRLGYRPALDGIRGVAIALVVSFHTLGLPEGGFLGVDLFFVLSGFLITTLLLEEHVRTGRVSLRAFYRRRALRLLPALFVMLGILLALSLTSALARSSPPGEMLFGALAGIGYFSNIVMAAEPGSVAMTSELRHLWSLAIEEQFYAIWPLVLVVLLAVRVRLALVVLAAGVVLTTAQQMHLYFSNVPWNRIGFGTDTRSVSVLIGCLFAVALVSGAGGRLRSLMRWCGPPAFAIGGALVLFNLERELFLGPLLVFATMSALVIVHVLDERSTLARALALRPIVFLGAISYSLYLWHVPVYILLGAGQRPEAIDLLALPLALSLATASYYLVEQPFLRRKHRPQPRADAEIEAPISRPQPIAVPEALPARSQA
jgi:peptidoglycan/LPS O-acetylase OafA/YrhL